MYPLIETIKCLDGKLFNMEYHQWRFEKSCTGYFGFKTSVKLSDAISIPEFAKTGLFRCRVTYSGEIEKVEFFPYEFRHIKRLKLIEDNHIEYSFKYAIRENLSRLFEKRGECDDIIIVKNNEVTDSFTSNLVFFDGKRWFTPYSPLLKGTQREKLVRSGIVAECKISPGDISGFQKVGLINALNNLEEMPQINVTDICF